MVRRITLARAGLYSLAFGGCFGTMLTVRLAAEIDPIIAGILGLCAFGCALFTLMLDRTESREADRLIELRAAMAYALHLHKESGSSYGFLFLRDHQAGYTHISHRFPTWPQFRADFIRKDGDA